MAAECLRYHSRLAELIADKKAESYVNTISWIRAKVSFAILRSAILCLRGSRSRKRSPLNITDHDMNLIFKLPLSYPLFLFFLFYFYLFIFLLIFDFQKIQRRKYGTLVGRTYSF